MIERLAGRTHSDPGTPVPPAPGRKVLLAPSVLSCDLGRWPEQVAAVERAGADWLHVDIMDGHFVPALTFGPRLVEALRRASRLPLDVHLMVERPEDFVEPFASAGASLISFHAEACRHPRRLCRHLRALGVRAGIALNPATPPDLLRYLAADLDLVVVMSVDPGFAGQPFLPETFSKLLEVDRVLGGPGGLGPVAAPPPGRPGPAQRPAGAGRPLIEVDGGVGPANAADLGRAGADVLVAGNSVFGQSDPGAAVVALRQALAAAGL